jgi:hypothetical protein
MRKLIPALSLVLISMLCAVSGRTEDEVKVSNPEPTQSTDVPFRLFATKNMWTFLKLDTRTVLVWQVQFSLTADSEGKTERYVVPVNGLPLAPTTSSPGRFTLYPTENIFNFLLEDQ